jgi:hypothetical protein
LLNRVAQAACIFTAGSRELLGSRVVRKSWGITYRDAPFFCARRRRFAAVPSGGSLRLTTLARRFDGSLRSVRSFSGGLRPAGPPYTVVGEAKLRPA